MTVEWRDICERCGEAHDASPDGLTSGHVCADRVDLLERLRRRRTYLIVRQFMDESFVRFQRDLLIHGRATIGDVTVVRETPARLRWWR